MSGVFKFDCSDHLHSLPRPIMSNPDVARLINSDAVQAVVRPVKDNAKRSTVKKNPLRVRVTLSWSLLLTSFTEPWCSPSPQPLRSDHEASSCPLPRGPAQEEGSCSRCQAQVSTDGCCSDQALLNDGRSICNNAYPQNTIKPELYILVWMIFCFCVGVRWWKILDKLEVVPGLISPITWRISTLTLFSSQNT